MINPIVGQYVLYIAQTAYATHVMICKRVLIEKLLCMHLVGLLWVCTIIICTMYVLPIHVGGSTYRVTECTKIYTLPCFDCLDSCCINSVQRTKVDLKK